MSERLTLPVRLDGGKAKRGPLAGWVTANLRGRMATAHDHFARCVALCPATASAG